MLVTGVSGGIRAATALELAKAGAEVIVNYSGSKESADKVVDETKQNAGNAIALQADVSKADKVTDAMSRHQFLRQAGFQGAALLALYCGGQSLTACKSDNVTPAPLTNPITIDLTNTANAALKTVGGYIVTNDVVVANTTQGYKAATVICSHKGKKQVELRNNEYYCTAHDARFDLMGKGLNKHSEKGLTVYKVTQAGTVLTIS